MTSGRQIAVFGAARCDDRLADLAFAVGQGIARAGATLVCGGRGGVMAAACRGARESGGLAVGILPGRDDRDSEPNDFLSVTLFSGVGQARNLAVALSGQAAIAVGGGWGTLSEIALALKHGVPVVSLESWHPRLTDGSDEPLLAPAPDPPTAVALALRLAAGRWRRGPAEPTNPGGSTSP